MKNALAQGVAVHQVQRSDTSGALGSLRFDIVRVYAASVHTSTGTYPYNSFNYVLSLRIISAGSCSKLQVAEQASDQNLKEVILAIIGSSRSESSQLRPTRDSSQARLSLSRREPGKVGSGLSQRLNDIHETWLERC